MAPQDDSRPFAPLGEVNQHYWLALRMAKATGVDLAQAMDADLLDQEGWSQMVTRCRGCVWAKGCTRWLDIPHDDLRALPTSCVNRDRFAALREDLDPKEDPK
ncbi:MAG: DUF6455 family protein [Paracoccaceae bacterium]|nr:DUF6455 family protein [Paracoccaceae bacterium]